MTNTLNMQRCVPLPPGGGGLGRGGHNHGGRCQHHPLPSLRDTLSPQGRGEPGRMQGEFS
jgi:hypothetical protein